jgi:hypothetical protein
VGNLLLYYVSLHLGSPDLRLPVSGPVVLHREMEAGSWQLREVLGRVRREGEKNLVANFQFPKV